jgi:hypothetical protein
VPIKDKNNPGQFKGKYKYRYATLPGILNHIRPEMAKNGLWYTQRVVSGHMVTRIIHQSGEWFDTGHVPMPDMKGDPQGIGAIISYFKRYSLTAAMGLAADDDDGETGEREVAFHARGAPEAQAGNDGMDDEPPMGWGDWTRGLIRTIQGKQSPDELDVLRDNNRRLINGVKRFDQQMYDDIGRAFTARRSVVDKNAPV